MPETVYRRYTCGVLGITIGLMLLTAAFNRVVDPFWYFRDVEVVGFNAKKPSFRLSERDVKPAILMREQPDAVILGSSYAEIGFDPLHPRLTDGGVAKSFNFAFGGAPWRMNFCTFEFVLSVAKPRRIVLGIHADVLPAADCTEDIARMKDTRWGALLLSASALEASIRTVSRQRKEKRNSHTREGLFIFTRFEPGVDERFRLYFNLILKGKRTCQKDYLERSVAIPGWSSPAEGSPKDLSGLRDIVNAVSGRDIKVKLVVYPRHALRMELDYLCGEAEARWQALWQIARYLETHPPAPPASIEIWDFQGYSAYTTEPLSSGLMAFWQDPEHFNYEFGNVMLDWMFGAVPQRGIDGLGYRVTTATLSARRAWFEEQRMAYLRAHPEAGKTLAGLLPPGLP